MKLQKHQIFTASYYFMLSLLGNGFIYYHFGSKKFTLVFFAISLIAIILHTKNAKNNDSYIRQNFGIVNSTRVVAYDYLRLLAILLVIITHTIQADMADNMLQGKTEKYIFTILYVLALVCNIIYVMLSGALLLSFRDEKLSNYYLKRVPKIAFPMLVYYFFYLWQFGYFAGLNKDKIKEYILNFMNGNTSMSPHYWLMFVILGLYLAYPFLRYMLKNMPYNVLSGLVVLIILFMAVNTWLPLVGIYSVVGTFFAGWIGVAIVGYWVSQKETRKYDGYFLALALCAVIAVCIIIKKSDQFTTIICNCTPIMVILGIAIFVLIFKIKKQNTGVMLSCLSKYSYGIILIHWGGLNWVTRTKLNIHVADFNYFGLVISVVVTLIVSFLMAYLVENLLILPARYFWNLLIDRNK